VERVASIVGLASHLGRGVQRIATDAILGRVRSLPRTIGDLDATALSQIMGRTVTSVAVTGGNFSTSTAGCWPAPAVPASTATSCGSATGRVEGLRRSVAALDDLDTVSLLEKSL
jgi:4-hydroxybenzoate polyprenyltransferase